MALGLGPEAPTPADDGDGTPLRQVSGRPAAANAPAQSWRRRSAKGTVLLGRRGPGAPVQSQPRSRPGRLGGKHRICAEKPRRLSALALLSPAQARLLL